MIRMIIARHGNTFLPDEEPRRVGGRTDLPLVPSGEAQARALGLTLRTQGLLPEVCFTSELQRTKHTARVALDAAQHDCLIHTWHQLNEIDYGIDENQPESVVRARLGAAALDAWEQHSTPPHGWDIDPHAMHAMWHNLAQHILADYAGRTIWIVTSNGIARFALSLLPDSTAYSPKLATGAYSIWHYDAGWVCSGWNIRP